MRVRLTNGRTLDANAVVLALGNLPPRTLPHVPKELTQTGRYQADPWRRGVLEGLKADNDLLIVGTGLTMVDLVVSLHSRGHRGRIYALSRRGLLPKAHLPRCRCESSDLHLFVRELEQNPPQTISKLLRQVRAAVETHTHLGGAWQEVVDSLRLISPLLWRSLGEAEKIRYLSRVRPYWEAHRHRIAPQVTDTVHGCQEASQLRVLAGQLCELKPTSESVEVGVSKRDGSRDTLHVARVVNATGPETDLRFTSHRLLRSLLAAGHIKPDTTGLGLGIGPDGQVLGTAALPLYALGALRRNESYEGTAVPELRQQAYDLAQTLIETLTSNFETRLRVKAST